MAAATWRCAARGLSDDIYTCVKSKVRGEWNYIARREEKRCIDLFPAPSLSLDVAPQSYTVCVIKERRHPLPPFIRLAIVIYNTHLPSATTHALTPRVLVVGGRILSRTFRPCHGRQPPWGGLCIRERREYVEGQHSPPTNFSLSLL